MKKSPMNNKAPLYGEFFLRLAGGILITVLLLNYVIQPCRVVSGSMWPTIPENSVILTFRTRYALGDPVPCRGDIVTIKDPTRNILLIKRVIGLPGDEISIADGHVLINGCLLNEDYLPEGTKTAAYTQSFYVVPDGSVFVMGDHRSTSKDSRHFEDPYIPISNIHAEFIVGRSL